MTLVPFVPDELLYLAGGGVVLYFVGVQGIRAALAKEQKKSIMTELIKQLGIKNFKPSDLNADKLDDKGFGRLMALVQLAQQSVGPQGQLGGLMQQIEQLKGLGQLAAAAGQVAMSPAVAMQATLPPAARTSQTAPGPSDEEP